MRPQTIGRALGIGVRIAGRIVGQRLTTSAQTATLHPAQPAVNTEVRAGEVGRAFGRVAHQSGGGFARGVGGFLQPFRRVGGIIWLEVTGVFFLLPVIAFTPNLWRMRASWARGPDHRMFLVTAFVVAVFLYLAITSFWRARRK